MSYAPNLGFISTRDTATFSEYMAIENVRSHFPGNVRFAFGIPETNDKGVKSDVVVPGKFSFIDVGEKDKENALPWDEIDSAKYSTWSNYFDYAAAIKNSNERMNNNHQLNLIEENAQWVKSKIDEKSVPLNYDKYKAKIALNNKEAERYEEINKYKTNLTFQSPLYEKELFAKDTTDLKEKRERWHQSLSQDVYVEEALNVLEDLKTSYNIKKVATVKN